MLILLSIAALPFIVLAVLVGIPLILHFMGPSLQGLVNTLFSRLGETYNYITDGEVNHNEHYSVLRHCKPFVVYQGVKTSVPITIFGDRSLPEHRRVFLQRRGYRTALLGWTLGSVLGGSKLPGIEVTPEAEESFFSLSSSRQTQTNKDIARLFPPSIAGAQTARQTMHVHIPVSSGDGYFRLRVTAGDPRTTLAESPVFRVGSLSLASAHPQGASLLGLVPELLVRSAFVAGRTTAYASFYAAFPFLKIAEWTPGPWRQYALRALYTHTLSPEQQGQVTDNLSKGKEHLRKANDSIYRKVPFGAVGVRTALDLQKDEDAGRGGVWFDRRKG